MTQNQAATTPQQDIFSEGAGAAPAEQTYPIEVDGETLELTLAQLCAAAQTGLSKQNAAVRLENAAAQVPDGNLYAAFLEEYPDVAPADIPAEVWERAEREGSLVSAYRGYELQRLREELAALQKNRENAAQAIGPACGDGETTESDPVVRALLGK